MPENDKPDGTLPRTSGEAGDSPLLDMVLKQTAGSDTPVDQDLAALVADLRQLRQSHPESNQTPATLELVQATLTRWVQQCGLPIALPVRLAPIIAQNLSDDPAADGRLRTLWDQLLSREGT